MGRFCLLLLFSFISILSKGQSARLTGKIINAGSGQPLANATVILLEKSQTSVADLNGVFSFNKLVAGSYSLKCSYAGYQEKVVEDILLGTDEARDITVSLEEKRRTGDTVVVAAKVRAGRETVTALLIAQKNSASVSDGITADLIRKTPDRSSSDVLKRVSGASIQDDRFAIIRGLNDRYNAAFINGAPLPSTESDRKAFAFDIFPAAILDNLVIYKTATADKSGEFAGGLIDITTKSVAAKNSLSVSFGISYNTLLTGKDGYFSEAKGKRDFIGLDDGTRALPKDLPTSKDLKNMTFAERADLAKRFGRYSWGISKDNTGPNHNFQISWGFNKERKQKEFFGGFFSVNYNRNYSFTEGERNSFEFDLTVPGSEPVLRGKYSDSIYNVETVVAALANFSLKIDPRNVISWKNNFSINTDNKLIKRIGPPDYTTDSTLVNRDAVRWFTSNRIFSTQLGGDHVIGGEKTRLGWLAAYSKVVREIPHLARSSYYGVLPDLFGNFSSGTISQSSGSGTMFFANSDEDLKSIKADITQPYNFLKNSQNFLKLGGGYQVRQRDFTSRLLGLSPFNRVGVAFDYTLLELPEDKMFLPEHLGRLANGKGGFILEDGTLSNSNYDASSALTYVYLMNDQRFFRKLRLIYGLRLERFNQKLNSIKNLNDTIQVNTIVTDFLPSVNFVWSFSSKMNLRLCYSQTVNRPEFRELAPYLFYDNVTTYSFEGFDTLQRARIKNYDFRYEFYPGRAQLFSISAFYKDLSQPIEIVSNPVFDNLAIYSNAKSAKIYGVEAEFRTLLSTVFSVKNENAILSKLTLAANAAYIKSSVQLGGFGFFDPSLLVTDRALQGQSPYLINSSLAYADEKSGFSSTLSLNRVGDRITIAGTVFDADIYEKARTVMDFQLAKIFYKDKLETKLTVRDILAQEIRFYFDFDKSKSFSGKDRYFSSTNSPRVISFSATYKF